MGTSTAIKAARVTMCQQIITQHDFNDARVPYSIELMQRKKLGKLDCLHFEELMLLVAPKYNHVVFDSKLHG